MHRHLAIAVLAAVSTLTVAASSTAASATEVQDTYCLQGRQSGYPGNCEFSTRAVPRHRERHQRKLRYQPDAGLRAVAATARAASQPGLSGKR